MGMVFLPIGASPVRRFHTGMVDSSYFLAASAYG